jgi:hypothetical protein
MLATPTPCVIRLHHRLQLAEPSPVATRAAPYHCMQDLAAAAAPRSSGPAETQPDHGSTTTPAPAKTGPITKTEASQPATPSDQRSPDASKLSSENSPDTPKKFPEASEPVKGGKRKVAIVVGVAAAGVLLVAAALVALFRFMRCTSNSADTVSRPEKTSVRLYSCSLYVKICFRDSYSVL